MPEVQATAAGSNCRAHRQCSRWRARTGICHDCGYTSGSRIGEAGARNTKSLGLPGPIGPTESPRLLFAPQIRAPGLSALFQVPAELDARGEVRATACFFHPLDAPQSEAVGARSAIAVG